MLNHLEILRRWASELNASRAEPVALQAEVGTTTGEKPAALLIVEGDTMAGQLTVWVSGECELGAYRVDDGVPVLLEHREVASVEDLELACRTLVAACGGDSRGEAE